MIAEKERVVGEHITYKKDYIEALRPQMDRVFRIMAQEVPEHLLHSLRVAEIARIMAAAAGFDEDVQLRIFHEALPHDIGKIFTGKTVLYKPDKLSHIEYEEVKNHPADGAWIMEKMNFEAGHIAVAREHQRYNNSYGYPSNIKPEAVSLHSRIVMTADVFDAILDPRRPNNSDPTELNQTHPILKSYFANGKLYPEMEPFYTALLETPEYKFLSETAATREDIAYFFETRALSYISRNSIVSPGMQNIVGNIIDMDYALFAEARRQGIPVDPELVDEYVT